MKYDIKQSKRAKFGTDERVGKLTLTAMNELDEIKLAFLANALCPVGDQRDEAFDRWIAQRIGDYLKANNLRIATA